jgi:hypothetical protein
MSFFDNTKTVGFVFIIIGLIILITAIAGGALNAINDDYESKVKIGYIIAMIASLIFGLLILGFGIKCSRGSNDHTAFLSGLVRVFAIATLLGAIFGAVGDYLINGGLGAAISSFILQIIIAIILFWAAAKVSGKNKNVISKIVWIVLVVVFILALIGSIGNCVGSISSDIAILMSCISYLCWALAYLFALAACFSKDVKSSMGI